MAFTEDLDTYFADFTDTVVYSGTTYKGIFCLLYTSPSPRDNR